MPIVLTILQEVVGGLLVAGLLALIAWLWRSGKALRDTVKRLETANEAQAAENALLHAYIERLNGVDEKYQDTLRGEARRSLIKEVAGLVVSTKQLTKDVAKLQEDNRSSRSTADGGMLPAQRLEQHVALQQPAAQRKPFFDREKLDRL